MESEFKAKNDGLGGLESCRGELGAFALAKRVGTPLAFEAKKFKAKQGFHEDERDSVGFRCSKFNGVIWLNAEHLGGCAFSVFYFNERRFVTHRTGCERYRLRSYF
ncbi:hypothetical protein [Campylobacter upsaliensis]|uniref:hypothetical protein n=1 Tax=Campylobacter upsaliensis TaxID=28080 RepID=UPI0022EB0137|nr:hypothetical protein [Campylobacter upsaliensis]